MDTILRPYQTSDLQAITDIINYNILYSTALYDYEIRTLSQQESLLNEKLHKGFPVIVVETAGIVSGFGYYGEFRFRQAYQYTVEHSVYVAPEYSSKGIGGKILISLIEIAKRQGKHTMIGVIDAENENSIRFHERYGFVQSGVLKETGYKFDRWLHSVFVQLMLG